MTPQQVINEARSILQDTDSDAYRYSDADLLSYVNEGIQHASVVRPDLFSAIGDYICVEGQCEQAITFADAKELVEVLCIHGGSAIIPFDFMTMGAFNPSWRTDTAGAAKQWCRFVDDPLRFFIYPKAPANQTIDVRYTKLPTVLALTDEITELPLPYHYALTDFVVGRAESRDDEHVNSQRAGQFLAQFTARLVGKG